MKRALGRNPFLDDEHRVTLLEEAAALGDRPLIIATLSGSTDPLRLLVNSPQLIAALSAREGQPGMGALMRALRVASPESITQLAALLEGSGLDDALRRAVRERVFTARTTYFRLVSADREQPRSSEHLGALCSLGKSFTKLELPVEFRALLEEASSPTLLRILDCFTMNASFYKRSPSRGDLFNRASSFDLAAAMRVELDRHHLEWCRVAYQGVGGFIATNIGKHQHLETFTRLLPEWRGSLAELLTSASTL